MADRKLARVLNHILTAAGDDCGVSDAELLERFTGQGDAAALELLVWRYQRLVLGICRRVLQDVHDAEDAFQATFLILARKAGSVGRREAIGGWLYQVATRAALAARAARSQRSARERSLGGNEAAASAEAESLVERQELWAVVDEEVSRLPERFRAAVVLCYFEGKTVDGAARQLGCPRGTVASRLARARERLRVRLTRRGLALTAGTLTAGLGQAGFAGATAYGLVRRTGQAVAALSAGSTVAGPALSSKTVALSEEVLRAMFIRKVTTGAAILVVGLMMLGGGLVLRLHFSAGAGPAPPAAASAPPKTAEDRAVPVIVGRPVRRKVAPFEDFTGRLEAVKPVDFRVVLPRKAIAVRFDMDELSYLRYQRLLRAGQVKGEGNSLAVGLSDENSFPRAGMLDHVENEFNPDTGTIGVHGVLPNADGLLLPGMFVRVRMTFGPPRRVLEVPEEAVGREQDQSYVWVVSDRHIVERRAVRTGATDGGMRIIEEGLRPEDRVVIAGAKGLKPGDHVEPQPVGQRPVGTK
ncbi:MAG TPA: efflux RND transporter periplasmic adaptor subunit [Gemmataceae bacterium]|nr:efflux RND transporter periplasmic adaptor subunit [Gemmataceae bacterium]